MKKLNLQDFCNRSIISHGDLYDYSLVEYKNNRTKIKIICKKHGIFEQVPESHMRGIGCPKCSDNHNYTNDEFIAKIIDIFGDNYIYDYIEYKNQKTKISLVCKKHGIMKKYPQTLLRGSGCSKCETKNYKIDNPEFIRRSQKIHNETYDYGLVNYINDSTPVNIICKRHGIFVQTPNSHLSGSGCIFCSGRNKSNKEDFINKSNSIHGIKYNYDNVNYINAHTKVEIVCKKHGIFLQKPNSHLLGKGCPSCKESKGENIIYNFLLENNINFIRQKTFSNCKYKSLLFFDFFIPDKNLCIEYDGEFHYKPIYGERQLEELKYRDNIKNLYCKENNIKLIRIAYTEFDNIEEILKNII